MKEPLIVISGPTGVGKTDISVEVAEKFNGEVIIADSIQIYRFLDIGSGKPTIEERKRVPHHLIDIIDPSEEFDAFQFAKLAREKIKSILKRGKIPIVCGGCGFYIRGLLRGEFNRPGRNEEVRSRIRARAEKEGWDTLFKELKKVDPETASRIHPHDHIRIVRALEVYYLTGKPLSSFRPYAKEPFYNVLFIALIRPREELYARINNRVEKMWKEGWVEEVKEIINKGFSPDSPGLKSIGYEDVVKFIQGKVTEEEAKEMIKKKTRNYAKRQISWLKKENPCWIQLEEAKDKMERMVKDFIEQLNAVR